MCVRVELMTADSGDLSGRSEFPLLSLYVCVCVFVYLGRCAVYNTVLIYIRPLLVLMPGISQLMAPILVIYTLTPYIYLGGFESSTELLWLDICPIILNRDISLT